MSSTITPLPFPTDYTAAQRAAIDAAAAEAISVRGVEYDHGGVLAQRLSRQLFAIFGDVAYELWCHTLHDDDGTVIEYIPAVRDGSLIGEFPDEGRCGVLHLIRFIRRRGETVSAARAEWSCAYLGRGWIYTDEINRSSAQILDAIADEVDAGFPRLTGGRPGWA